MSAPIAIPIKNGTAGLSSQFEASSGADIYQRENDFLVAAATNNITEVTNLIAAGVDLLARDVLGNCFGMIHENPFNRSRHSPLNGPINLTALHIAVWNNHISIVNKILAAAEQQGKLKDVVSAKDNAGILALHVAQGPECVRALIDAGSPLDVADGIGRTPLHEMAERGDVLCATILLDRFSPNTIPFWKETATVLNQEQSGLPRVLIDLINSFTGNNNDLINKEIFNMRTPLYVAIVGPRGDANEAMVKFLLERCANPKISCMHGLALKRTPLLEIVRTANPPLPQICALIEDAVKTDAERIKPDHSKSVDGSSPST